MLIPFSPPPGLNSDDTTFAAQGRWADGVNVRFYLGKPQVRGGDGVVFSISNTNGVCRCILPFNRAGAVSVAYGLTKSTNGADGTTKLYVGSGLSTPSDWTPSGLAGTEPNWSLAPWGSTLLAVPEGGKLYEQAGTGAATAVTAAPDQITYMLVTPQRQVLALGCNEEVSTTFNGLCIRGCDLENYNDWTTSATNNAFETLLDGAGSIVTGRVVGNYVAVWTTDTLYLGQFIGDPSQTFRFDPVATGAGLIGPNAVVVVDGTAYWIGADLRVHSWAPGGPVQIMPCPISKRFRDSVEPGTGRFAVASHNARFSEVRFDYFSSESTAYPPGAQIGNYIAVSLIDGSWHRGNGGKSAILDSELFIGPTAQIGAASLIGADENGEFFEMESGNLIPSAFALQPYIESADQYLDNSQRRMMIRGVIPDFEGQVGDVQLTLFVRDRPQSTPVTKGPYTLTAQATKKDFRASGKIVAARWTGVAGDQGTYFRLGKPLFDTVPTGEG